MPSAKIKSQAGPGPVRLNITMNNHEQNTDGPSSKSKKTSPKLGQSVNIDSSILRSHSRILESSKTTEPNSLASSGAGTADNSKKTSIDNPTPDVASNATTKLGKRKRQQEDTDANVVPPTNTYSLRRRKPTPEEEASATNGTKTSSKPEQPKLVVPPRAKKGRQRGRKADEQKLLLSNAASPANVSSMRNSAKPEQPKNKKQAAPGRRRAPNSNPHIEADLRRQAQLKANFKNVVKGLRPLLLELSKRSIDELEADVHAHEYYPQFAIVQESLDKYLAARLAHLDATLKFEKKVAETTLKSGKEYIEKEFQSRAEDIREECLATICAEIVDLQRKSQEEDDSDATEDENEPMDHEISDASPFSGQKYNSRSRLYLDLERVFKTAQARSQLWSLVNHEVQHHPEHIDQEYLNDQTSYGRRSSDSYQSYVSRRNLSVLIEATKVVQLSYDGPPSKQQGFEVLLQAIDIKHSPTSSSFEPLMSPIPMATVPQTPPSNSTHTQQPGSGSTTSLSNQVLPSTENSTTLASSHQSPTHKIDPTPSALRVRDLLSA